MFQDVTGRQTENSTEDRQNAATTARIEPVEDSDDAKKRRRSPSDSDEIIPQEEGGKLLQVDDANAALVDGKVSTASLSSSLSLPEKKRNKTSSDDSNDKQGKTTWKVVDNLDIDEDILNDSDALDMIRRMEGEFGDQENDGSSTDSDYEELQGALQMSKLPLKTAAKNWNLAPFLLENLEKEGFTHFFPIQGLAIPDVMTSECHQHIRHRDICISAPTGSGKTLAFVLPILNALKTRQVLRLRALVVLPSEDVAKRVYEVFQKYVHGSDLKVGLAAGDDSTFRAEQIALTVGDDVSFGADHMNAMRQLHSFDKDDLKNALNAYRFHNPAHVVHSTVDILVCTPDRLIDHLDHTPGFTLQHLRFLVIDEAERFQAQRSHGWIYRIHAAITATAAMDLAKVSSVAYYRSNRGRSQSQTRSVSISLPREVTPADVARALSQGVAPPIPPPAPDMKMLGGALTDDPWFVLEPITWRRFAGAFEGEDSKHKYNTSGGSIKSSGRRNSGSSKGETSVTKSVKSEKTDANNPNSNTANLFLPIAATAASLMCQPVQVRKFLVSSALTRDAPKLTALQLIKPKHFDVNQVTPATNEGGGKGEEEKREIRYGEDGIEKMMKTALKLRSSKYSMPKGLAERTLICTAEQKPIALLAVLLEKFQKKQLIGDEDKKKEKNVIVVFTSSLDSTHRLVRLLQLIWQAAGYGEPSTVAEYSTGLSRKERERVVARCNDPADCLGVIICSDAVSRRMDLKKVEVVINYDIPGYAKTYVHRCGHTARTGDYGEAISLLKGGQFGRFKKMRNLINAPGDVKILGIKKDLIRDALPKYRDCMKALKKVLLAEEGDALSFCDPNLERFIKRGE